MKYSVNLVKPFLIDIASLCDEHKCDNLHRKIRRLRMKTPGGVTSGDDHFIKRFLTSHLLAWLNSLVYVITIDAKCPPQYRNHQVPLAFTYFYLLAE